MKVFIVTTIATEEQNVSVMPDETQTGLVIETKELDDKTLNGRLYLNKGEAETLISIIKQTINYLDL